MSPLPRILVIDGNLAATRAAQLAAGGQPSGEGYAQVLQELAPLSCDIVRPADAPVQWATGTGLADYDGAVITGSALNVYAGGPPVTRQLELAAAVGEQGLPLFGSCWGLQLAVTAAGGSVRPNPLGREFGFARRIQLTDLGRAHPMFTGKPSVFEAITVHSDEVEHLPHGARVLAVNDAGIQAVEFELARSTVWAVQYHPEYSFVEIAATALRYAASLLADGWFASRADLEQYVAELRRLQPGAAARALCWKYGIGGALLETGLRRAELHNWLQHQVLAGPARRRHARAG